MDKACKVCDKALRVYEYQLINVQKYIPESDSVDDIHYKVCRKCYMLVDNTIEGNWIKKDMIDIYTKIILEFKETFVEHDGYCSGGEIHDDNVTSKIVRRECFVPKVLDINFPTSNEELTSFIKTDELAGIFFTSCKGSTSSYGSGYCYNECSEFDNTRYSTCGEYFEFVSASWDFDTGEGFVICV